MTDYKEFLKNKGLRLRNAGISVSPDQIHPMLFDFQRDVVVWALRKGRAALFLDTGTGKTFTQLEWARLITDKSLIVAPLSVARQTVREATKVGIDLKYVRRADEVGPTGMYITNYEMLDEFASVKWGAVVLDESSILKSLDSKTRRKVIDMFQDVPYRLACTATPAPNDQSEIGNHAEFLGVCKRAEMLAMFFVHANKQTEIDMGDGRIVRNKEAGSKGQEWRLKNHAKTSFYKWMASWSVAMRLPSDLGYDDDGYILPPLNVKPVYVTETYRPDNQLLFTGLGGIQGRSKIRKMTASKRIDEAVNIIEQSNDQWIVWCGLNQEADEITKRLSGAVNVQGSDKPEDKAAAFEDFQDGKVRVLVSKSRIAGFGMNFQNAHNMLFLGLNDSWESYYQCIRRQWRYGQTEPVNVWIVISDIEESILRNVMQKEETSKRMVTELISNISIYEKEELLMTAGHDDDSYYEETQQGKNWTLMLGDSATRLAEVDTNSIDLSVYSPPFADLFTYSASERDLGNTRDWAEFFDQYAFMIREILRVTVPGRLTCVHTSDIPAMLVKDGYIGMKDFPGEVIRAYEREGWIFVGRAIVTKSAQQQAIRTKAKALLFVQLRKDSSDSRPAILDQILLFKKPGDNPVPVKPVENGEIDNETWIDWAGGIWTGIHESDTLQYTTARDPEDERHICPLQLGTIERCIKLYSNPGETVLTPFMGIGSEAYQAIKFGRKAIGIELKPSYFRIAVQNVERAEYEQTMPDLFSWASSIGQQKEND